MAAFLRFLATPAVPTLLYLAGRNLIRRSVRASFVVRPGPAGIEPPGRYPAGVPDVAFGRRGLVI